MLHQLDIHTRIVIGASMSEPHIDELKDENCVCTYVCMYVCMYVYM